MKGFRLKNGDVVIEDDINLIDGIELLCQNIKQILGSNIKEWLFNENYGIDFKEIFVKNPNYNHITDIIKEALLQIDSDIEFESIEYILGKNRKLSIYFSFYYNDELISTDYEIE